MAVAENLKGKRFGRLTVLTPAPHIVYKNGRRRTAWYCLCECGNTCVVSAVTLKSGGTKSCGCLKTERNKNYFTKHDGCKDRLYKVWTDIKKRCNNPHYKQYKDYGGRGIKICLEWAGDYAKFRDFAYQNGYDPCAKFGECTIDRIDVDGDYCPENCRFVSMKIQNNNRRSNKDGTIR